MTLAWTVVAIAVVAAVICGLVVAIARRRSGLSDLDRARIAVRGLRREARSLGRGPVRGRSSHFWTTSIKDWGGERHTDGGGDYGGCGSGGGGGGDSST